MVEAYLKASGGGLKVRPRQIMYAARDHIQKRTGKPLDDRYFCQTLLPDFISANPELTKDWDIVWDARGTLVEPHTGKRVPLGTEEVRRLHGRHGQPLPPHRRQRPVVDHRRPRPVRRRSVH